MPPRTGRIRQAECSSQQVCRWALTSRVARPQKKGDPDWAVPSSTSFTYRRALPPRGRVLPAILGPPLNLVSLEHYTELVKRRRETCRRTDSAPGTPLHEFSDPGTILSLLVRRLDVSGCRHGDPDVGELRLERGSRLLGNIGEDARCVPQPVDRPRECGRVDLRPGHFIHDLVGKDLDLQADPLPVDV